jgi:putative heme-binding domain-containing protein
LRNFASKHRLIGHAVLAPEVTGQALGAEFGPNAPVNTNPALVINDFHYQVLLQGMTPEPMDIRFSPDGRLWITGRRGEIWAYTLETGALKRVATLKVPWQPVPSEGIANERGLHGIEFDPKYPENGHVYLYYSTLSAGLYSNRVSRFTVAQNGRGDELETNSEKVLVEFPSVLGKHQGGALGYNPKDGKLYVTVGDNYVPPNRTKLFGYYVPKTPPLDLHGFRGKTLRLNLDGSIPADNPFVNKSGARGEIYTIGHRNAFTMNIDDATGRVFVGEVGEDTAETWEEINLLSSGHNYGWPFAHGKDIATVGGGKCDLPGETDPWFCYLHDQVACVCCGPFYRGNHGQYDFPCQWQNGLFYGDLMRKSVRFIQADAKTGAAVRSVPFATGFAGGPIAMREGPDGALYVAEYAGWFCGSPNDRISRITYGTTNQGAATEISPYDVPPAVPADAAPQISQYSLEGYQDVLAGGIALRGQAVFTVQCARCHKINGQGGEVGPNLSKIGAEKSRQFLLESILWPNKEIAPGFQSELVTLNSGVSYDGVIKAETAGELTVQSPEDGLLTLKKNDIRSRRKRLSPMPEGFGRILSKQDLGNVVEYLSSLK